MISSKQVLTVILLVAVVFSITSCGKEGLSSRIAGGSHKKEILYYTCGMHPSVKVTPAEYKKGQVNCPICNMKLVPVYKEEVDRGAEVYYGCGMEGEEHVFLIKGKPMEKCPVCGMALVKLSKEKADKLKGIVSRVKVKGEQARLAGVRTEPVRVMRLFKEIRTVGKVAYDPDLAITQEEFISAVKTLDKMSKGDVDDIKEMTERLVNSSKRKLKLLGLSEEQIRELEDTKEVETSLILPEKKMWIYGDVYEYELSWIMIGEKVRVVTASLPGEKFTGIISSVNPVVDPKTRSIRFRAEVQNPNLRLKPEMYVDMIIMSAYKSPDGNDMVLAIPKNAVLDTGLRKIVWIDKENGEYEGRIVEVGPEASGEVGGTEKLYPVLRGLKEGELVVTKANFLIDSQSQLTGVAVSAYGGSLGAEEQKPAERIHQHQ
ncbi:MAG: efflux RND transporter periplasmic adaptor subunit [Candidatus Omnitrophica bacterium]|nr:efflux RND transporter periplasmic adaptor subunit [Candidatus Omnitrophota bacterium]